MGKEVQGSMWPGRMWGPFLQAQAFERVRLAQVAKKAVEWKELVCQEPCWEAGARWTLHTLPQEPGRWGASIWSCLGASVGQRGPEGPFPKSLCALGWAGLGRHLQHPLMAVSILSPAATLKCKQDELQRKALQTLER